MPLPEYFSCYTRQRIEQHPLARLLRKPQSFVSNDERGQRRIDLLRIVEALKGYLQNVKMPTISQRAAIDPCPWRPQPDSSRAP
jgi:hypothetical protein